MKLRIQPNALRLRLSGDEVAQLVERGRLEEAIEFGAKERLTYALEIGAQGTEVRARYERDKITVTLPPTARTWHETDQLGFESEQVIAETGRRLRITVEKDLGHL